MGERLRVLVVDDDFDSATLMAIMLQGWGHQVLVAHDGRSALVAMEQNPDVVLLDLAMPGMGGLEVAGKIRAQPTHKPFVIAISGYGDEDTRRKSLEAGAHMYLAKPLNPGVLRDTLERFAGVAE